MLSLLGKSIYPARAYNNKKIGDTNMEEKKVQVAPERATTQTKENAKGKWRKPKLEDVSGKIMAQPYIRFT